MDDPVDRSQDVGLCARCRHADVVVSSRGSRFYLCRLSATNPRFARYPRLPMLTCPGYRSKAEPPAGQN